MIKAVTLSGVFMAIGLLAFPAQAQRSQTDPLESPEYKFQYDPTLKKPWQESEVPLPAYPDPANLVEAQVGPTTNHAVLVDSASISTGKDNVVRLSYVVVTSGARNAVHEGIRCTTHQYKTYAYGTTESTWQPLERSNWAAIREVGANTYRNDLHQLVCNQHDMPRSERDIVRRLKYKVENNQP